MWRVSNKQRGKHTRETACQPTLVKPIGGARNPHCRGPQHAHRSPAQKGTGRSRSPQTARNPTIPTRGDPVQGDPSSTPELWRRRSWPRIPANTAAPRAMAVVFKSTARPEWVVHRCRHAPSSCAETRHSPNTRVRDPTLRRQVRGVHGRMANEQQGTSTNGPAAPRPPS